MELFFATTNPHKAQEMQQLLASANVTVRAPSELVAELPEPAEDADTFEGNAALKAAAYARAIGRPCLADDSGIEVAALGGAPGVHSARYAGTGATRPERDAANRYKLLTELAKLGNVDRSAQLVCALCLADATGNALLTTRGSVSATIATEPRGTNGFGYDNVLWLPNHGKMLAELDAQTWNAESHRAAAARKLIWYLSTLNPGTPLVGTIVTATH